MELPSEPAVAVDTRNSSGFLGSVGWFLSGAVLPLGSLSFYRNASRRTVGLAVLFFIVFTVFISVLTTISVGVNMAGVVSEIHKEYQNGRIPTITISGGVAEVSGPQPLILADEQTASGAMLMAIDTTGQLNEIDQSTYVQGFLLTRNELHVLNSGGRYQRMPLSEINALFSSDPLVIDERSITNAWAAFSAAITVLALIGLVLWNTVVRLMIIAVLALIFWGIGSLFRPKIGYGPFIITGLYAIVPAIYLSHVFSRSQASFPGLQSILLILFWAVGLVAVLSQNQFFAPDRPLRLWTALIGVPMLVWFIVDMFAKLPSPTAQIVLWVLTILTVVALICVRLYFRLSAAQPPAAAPGPLPPAA